MANENLHKAKEAKNDEFYTQLNDVAEELRHYKEHFKGKVVFCNCDDPTSSAFWKYFHLNFAELGLRKLISTHYDREKTTYKMEYTGGDDNDIKAGVKTLLEGNGDFRNKECLNLLDECDIVVTNPPFSLFREYIAVLMEHEKKFLIIGNRNALTYKEIFPLIRDDKLWLGNGFRNGNAYFRIPENADTSGYAKGVYDDTTKLVKFRNCVWFTNMDLAKRHEKLVLWKKYTPKDYPKYDNYLAWNVNKVSEIPCNDYIDIEIDESELELYKSIYPDLEVLSND
ncbi:adenine-specific methyltransferase EcoRI family protein [Ruminococcus sp. RTP21484sp1_RTP31023st1_H8_RTP31023_210422]|uniref:adenine-specific methyltransferase EcoRI family protein n=1 Tax=Ruminococcus sp. RTP21484sp1_RTP31023st1_H8_RTP31023_210422 TaxID=3141611 RepID=UPI0034A13CA4